LKTSLETAVVATQQDRMLADAAVYGASTGTYIQMQSRPGIALNLEALEAPNKDIQLVAFTQTATPPTVESATIFIPDGEDAYFTNRLEKYANPTPKKPKEHRHESMFDPVETLRLAPLVALWTDAPDLYPDSDAPIWWEVWLRKHDGREVERFYEFSGLSGIQIGPRRLEFENRIVLLAYAAASQLASSLVVLDDLAELRLPKACATEFRDMSSQEQSAWTQELKARTTAPQLNSAAVCILDTGVNRGHPLLESALAVEDCHTCNPQWGTHDHHGHGSEMAGLATYGDLTQALASTAPVILKHCLESVKILPPDNQPPNPPELYGAITAEATSRVEIQAPDRKRVFSMAVSAPEDRDRGQCPASSPPRRQYYDAPRCNPDTTARCSCRTPVVPAHPERDGPP